jgi:hypothetical protein
MKTCSDCGEAKLATREFFHPHAQGLLRGRCRKCAYLKNREKMLARAKLRYAANPEEGKAKSKARYEAKKVEILAQCKEYRERPERKAARNEWQRTRRRQDPIIRLNRTVSSYINQSLCGTKRGRRWQTLTGYDLHALRRHLERQFTGKMNWQNYGKVWHIDHIRPVKSFAFDAADSDEFRACWALANLRPLPVAENLKKSGKLLFLL